jgi:hypothetical protein
MIAALQCERGLWALQLTQTLERLPLEPVGFRQPSLAIQDPAELRHGLERARVASAV